MLTCVALLPVVVRMKAAMLLYVTGGVSRPLAYARLRPDTLSTRLYVVLVLPGARVNVKGGAVTMAGRRSQRPT
jgi:hypothetical protein